MKGPVLYLTLEGGRRFNERVIAFRTANSLDGADVPFRVARGSIDLRNGTADVQPLIDEILATEKVFGAPVQLVVIDTLSRALSGGDENTSDTMGGMIRNIDRIRLKTSAAVLLVHHSGKDKKAGARGHSILQAAVDTEIEIVNDETPGIIIAKPTKQRDYDVGTRFGYRLKQIEIGQSLEGTSIRSCVVESVDIGAMEAFSSKHIKSGTRADKALHVLHDLISSKPEIAPENIGFGSKTPVVLLVNWQKEFIGRHYPDAVRQTRSEAFKSAKDNLVKANQIEIHREYVGLYGA